MVSHVDFLRSEDPLYVLWCCCYKVLFVVVVVVVVFFVLFCHAKECIVREQSVDEDHSWQ